MAGSEQTQTSNIHIHGAAVVQAPGNGMAVAGFVMTLVALVLFWIPGLNVICWILGVVFSAVGWHRASKHNLPHKGLAIAGVCVSVAPLVGIISVFAALASV